MAKAASSSSPRPGPVGAPRLRRVPTSASVRLRCELRFGFWRQRPDDDIEQIGNAAAVERADGVGLLPAQDVKLGGLQLALLVVGLVRRPRSRAPGAVRRIAAASWSAGVMPCFASTTKTMTSASSIASRAWSWTRSSMGSPGRCSRPPVSMTMKRRPFHSATSYSRSRVVRARSSTIAMRSPTTRLNSVLLPTLGRPTKATTGRPSVVVTRPARRRPAAAPAPSARPRRRLRERRGRPCSSSE